MIKPIETQYKGYRFRSRLEARWAVFLDALKIRWEYEKEGYQLESGWYLPDFWLPQFNMFLEVKKEQLEKEDLSKARALAFGDNGFPVLVMNGLADVPQGTFFCHDIDDGGGGPCVMNKVAFAYCHICKTVCLDFGDWDDKYGRGDRVLCASNDFPQWRQPCVCFPPKIQRTTFGEIVNAVHVARSARFEHGETGGI